MRLVLLIHTPRFDLLTSIQIAAAEPHGSNLWSHHISRLLHITFLRRAKYGNEPHPFILWWVSHIDLYALLSGAGAGEFVRAVIDHQMLPGSDSLLYPNAPEGYSVIYTDEHESLPVIMRLYHDTFRLAAQLGFLAVELRRNKQNLSLADDPPRLQEMNDLRQALSGLWESPDVAFLHQHQDSLPRRSREIIQQVRCSLCVYVHVLISSSQQHYITRANSFLTVACGLASVSSLNTPRTERLTTMRMRSCVSLSELHILAALIVIFSCFLYSWPVLRLRPVASR